MFNCSRGDEMSLYFSLHSSSDSVNVSTCSLYRRSSYFPLFFATYFFSFPHFLPALRMISVREWVSDTKIRREDGNRFTERIVCVCVCSSAVWLRMKQKEEERRRERRRRNKRRKEDITFSFLLFNLISSPSPSFSIFFLHLLSLFFFFICSFTCFGTDWHFLLRFPVNVFPQIDPTEKQEKEKKYIFPLPLSRCSFILLSVLSLSFSERRRRWTVGKRVTNHKEMCSFKCDLRISRVRTPKRSSEIHEKYRKKREIWESHEWKSCTCL